MNEWLTHTQDTPFLLVLNCGAKGCDKSRNYMVSLIRQNGQVEHGHYNERLSCRVAVNVHMPKDRISQSHQGYGFVEFLGEEDADYSIKIMNMIKLYGKPIRVNKVRCDETRCSFLGMHGDRVAAPSWGQARRM